MALSDRKMPIVEGVNDIPSSLGSPSHPNGALMCQKYNDLIDNELSTIENNIPSTTDDLSEGTTNKYFSNSLARQAVSLTAGTSGVTYNSTTGVFDFSNVVAEAQNLAPFTTDDLTEGTTNKYYSDSASRASISLTAGTSGATYDNVTGVLDLTNLQAGISDLNDFTSDDLAEGTTNKYYADSLARNAISITGNGSYDSATGVITISNADVSIDHITKTSTAGLVDTYTIYGDSGETIEIDTFTVTNGRAISNTSYNSSTGILTLTFSDSTTFNTSDLRGQSPTVSIITQSAYDTLGSYDSNTFYIIVN